MDSTLQELSDLICVRFPSYDLCMYGIRRLNINSKPINAKLRRDWNNIEQEKIKCLLNEIMQHEREDNNFKYYKYVIYNRIAVLL